MKAAGQISRVVFRPSLLAREGGATAEIDILLRCTYIRTCLYTRTRRQYLEPKLQSSQEPELNIEGGRETVLTIVDKAYVLVNGAVAFEGEAGRLGEDHALQAKLLGVVQDEESTSIAREAIA